jgi:hypothetical protein
MPAPEKPFIPLLSGSAFVWVYSRKSLSSISSMSCQSLRISFYPSTSQSLLSLVVRFLSPIPFLSASFPLPLSRLHLRTRLDIFNVFLTISSIRSNPSFVLTSVFHHISVGNFQLLSPRLRQCTLVLRFLYF